MNGKVKRTARRAGQVALKAGKSAARVGAMAAVTAATTEFKRAVQVEKRKVVAKSVSKAALVTAAAVAAGLIVKSRMK